MIDDLYHPTDVQNRSEDHRHAREAAEHAVDALRNGDLSRARALLNEAQAAVERAAHDSRPHSQREVAYDCYE